MKVLVACLISAHIFFVCAPVFSEEIGFRHEIIKKLSDTFDKKFLEDIFFDSRVGLGNLLPVNPVCNVISWKDLREKVISSESVTRGREYLKQNEKVFTEIEKKYKGRIDRYIIASILRIESDFGRCLGAQTVINALYEMYVEVPRRRPFVITQLRHFFSAAIKNGWDIFSVPGSNAGAFGLPQFIPRSYTKLAVDGDGDGKIDLFSLSDAVASIANYLSRHQWGETLKSQKHALFHYNKESRYINIILEYRALLKKK